MSPSQREAIDAPGAWLTTVASRVCLDLLGSARARRERYVGEWIPEPVPDGPQWVSSRSAAAQADPADQVTLDESINMAFLVVLESMTPAERVAFIHHDVFGYPFPEVAQIVGRTPAACRQLATSARRRVRSAEVPVAPSADHANTVREFERAWVAKDIRAMVRVLDPDVVATADGGGVVSAILDPIVGDEQVARGFLNILESAPDLTLHERIVNGQPGLLLRHHGVTAAVIAFDVVGDRIKHVWAVRNPEKLRPWMTD
jgi:RNA polymerase sigma-70 factor (ECF subfamily)